MRTRPGYEHKFRIICIAEQQPGSRQPTASGSTRAPQARARRTGEAGQPKGQAANGRAAIPFGGSIKGTRGLVRTVVGGVSRHRPIMAKTSRGLKTAPTSKRPQSALEMTGFRTLYRLNRSCGYGLDILQYIGQMTVFLPQIYRSLHVQPHLRRSVQ